MQTAVTLIASPSEPLAPPLPFEPLAPPLPPAPPAEVGHAACRAGQHDNHFNFLRLVLAALVLLSHAPELVDGDRRREPLTRLFDSMSCAATWQSLLFCAERVSHRPKLAAASGAGGFPALPRAAHLPGVRGGLAAERVRCGRSGCGGHRPVHRASGLAVVVAIGAAAALSGRAADVRRAVSSGSSTATCGRSATSSPVTCARGCWASAASSTARNVLRLYVAGGAGVARAVAADSPAAGCFDRAPSPGLEPTELVSRPGAQSGERDVPLSAPAVLRRRLFRALPRSYPVFSRLGLGVRAGAGALHVPGCYRRAGPGDLGGLRVFHLCLRADSDARRPPKGRRTFRMASTCTAGPCRN